MRSIISIHLSRSLLLWVLLILGLLDGQHPEELPDNLPPTILTASYFLYILCFGVLIYPIGITQANFYLLVSGSNGNRLKTGRGINGHCYTRSSSPSQVMITGPRTVVSFSGEGEIVHWSGSDNATQFICCLFHMLVHAFHGH
jgi:hypothetical protein